MLTAWITLRAIPKQSQSFSTPLTQRSSPKSFIRHQDEAVHVLKGLVLGMVKRGQKMPERKKKKAKVSFYKFHHLLDFNDKISA